MRTDVYNNPKSISTALIECNHKLIGTIYVIITSVSTGSYISVGSVGDVIITSVSTGTYISVGSVGDVILPVRELWDEVSANTQPGQAHHEHHQVVDQQVGEVPLVAVAALIKVSIMADSLNYDSSPCR